MRDSPTASTSFMPRNGCYPVVLVVGGTSHDVRALLANLEVRGMRAEHWEAGKPWGDFPPPTDIVILCKDLLPGSELDTARAEVRGADVVLIETRSNWNNARSALARRGLLRYWTRSEPGHDGIAAIAGTPGEQVAPAPKRELPPENPSDPAGGARAPVTDEELKQAVGAAFEPARAHDGRGFRERISVLAGKLSDALPDDVDEVLITASRLRMEVVVNPRRNSSG